MFALTKINFTKLKTINLNLVLFCDSENHEQVLPCLWEDPLVYLFPLLLEAGELSELEHLLASEQVLLVYSVVEVLEHLKELVASCEVLCDVPSLEINDLQVASLDFQGLDFEQPLQVRVALNWVSLVVELHWVKTYQFNEQFSKVIFRKSQLMFLVVQEGQY